MLKLVGPVRPERFPLRVSEKIALALEKSILKGEFPAGTRFPSERELTERFGASRSSVREAVGRLAQLGLVRTHPQSGTYVTDYRVEGSMDLLAHLMRHGERLDREVVLSLLEFRRMAESFAVRKAVLAATAEDLLRLESIVKEESKKPIGFREMADCDYALHALVVRLSGNLVLQLLFNSFKPVYRFYVEFFFRLPGATERTVEQHRRLVTAFRRRDPDLADKVLSEALRYGEKRVLAALGPAAGAESDRGPRASTRPPTARRTGRGVEPLGDAPQKVPESEGKSAPMAAAD